MKKANAQRRIEQAPESIEQAPESATRRKAHTTIERRSAVTSAPHDEGDHGIALAFVSDGCGPNFL